MKTIILLAIIVLFGACHEESPKPSYTDVTGNWAFSGIVSGDIRIANSKSPQIISGYWEIGDSRYMTSSQRVSEFPENIGMICGQYYIVFHNLSVSIDYKSMTSTIVEYRDVAHDQLILSKTITFVRK